MRIGEAARRAGVSAHTLRFYERKGLLQPAARSSANYRDYSPASIEQLLFIRGAQRVGFTLAELRTLLDPRTRALGCAELKRIAEKKMGDIDADIRRLKRMRASIRGLIQECEGSAERCHVEIALERVRRG
jgi:DNA-binding transcriptional MerR regulator